MLKNINIQIIVTSVLLLIVIAIFQFTELDIYIQNSFYSFETKTWIIDKKEPILKFVLYDGLKKLLILFAVLVLSVLLFLKKNKLVQEYKKGLLIVLFSAIFVPLTIGLFKNITNTPCPCNITHFNGKYPNIKVFDSYPEDFIKKSKIRCWPAGHASTGFALMSLFFLLKKDSNRKKILIIAVIIGCVMGSYKMLIGDHFFSHTLITMLMAWLIILNLYKLITRKGFF